MIDVVKATRLTPGEAGRILGVGPQRIRDLVDEGRLPAERTATGVRLIPIEAVQKMLEERQQRERDHAR